MTFDDNWIKTLGYEPEERNFDLDWWNSRVEPHYLSLFEIALNDYIDGAKPYYEIEYVKRWKI